MRGYIKRKKDELQIKARGDYSFRPKWARWGAIIHKLAMKLEHRSKGMIRFMNPHLVDLNSDWFIHGQMELHGKIDSILSRQKSEYGAHAYFYGYLYQALGILNIYGERPTEERFDDYQLRDVINKDDRILDMGCNAGFMAIITCYRTGAHVDGLDINPYMIEVGEVVAQYLRLSSRVKLSAERIQDFKAELPYDVVFSFATHWTDDEQYRVSYREHFDRIADYLKPGGILVFESHSADLLNPDYLPAMKELEKIFEPLLCKRVDAGERDLWHFRKRCPDTV